MALFRRFFVNSPRSVGSPPFRGVRAANPTLKRTESVRLPSQGQNKGRGSRCSEKGGPRSRSGHVQCPNVGKQVRVSYLWESQDKEISNNTARGGIISSHKDGWETTPESRGFLWGESLCRLKETLPWLLLISVVGTRPCIKFSEKLMTLISAYLDYS